MNLDPLNLIITKLGDGGDTAQREGFYNITRYRQVNDYSNAIAELEVRSGIWVRHPTQYPNPKDFSRDQTIPNIIAMGLLNYHAPLKRMLKKQLMRFGFYQNWDYWTLEDVGYYVRAFKFWPLYPILWLGDLVMLINTCLICFLLARNPSKLQQWLGRHVSYIFVQGSPNNAQGVPQDIYGDSNVGNDLNHMAALYQAQMVMPTFISYLARKVYEKFRPHGIMYPLPVYFKVDNPDLADYWKPILEKF